MELSNWGRLFEWSKCRSNLVLSFDFTASCVDMSPAKVEAESSSCISHCQYQSRALLCLSQLVQAYVGGVC